MPIKVQVPTENQINELRTLFLRKYETNPPAVPFHPADLGRVRNSDLWCRRFLEMYDIDMKVALEKLWETCIWRQEYGANDLDESNLREDYLKDGAIFSHNKDVDGKPLLIFKTKLHVRGSKNMKEVMRVVVYWIERIHREHEMAFITIFFDMDGTGISNMDLEFVKGIIDTFKMYYPNALNYILIYEMAWVLNAAFKIVKGLLPPKAHEILKVITKKDIHQYIDKNNCLTSWGGNDTYEFRFVPEVKKLPVMSKITSNVVISDEQTNVQEKDKKGNTSGKFVPEVRKSPVLPTITSNVVIPDEQTNGQEKDKKVHFANSSPTRLAEMKDFKDPSTPHDHEMLRIVPNDYIMFSRDENTESNIEISNISKFPVTYKIQTTSPDKFRVRPRCGYIMPGDIVPISILLKHDHKLSQGSKDKFLVMSMAVPQHIDTNVQQPAELWLAKTVGTAGVEQHRLICAYKNGDDFTSNGINTGGYNTCPKFQQAKSDVKQYVDSELDKQSKLESQVHTTRIIQYIMLGFMVLLSVGFYFLWQQLNGNNASMEHNYRQSFEKRDQSCRT